jgi:biopolymer transport protein ExbD
MTLQKNTLLVLVMFTIVCALPAAAAVVPSAIAQEENDENLASSIVSEVLKDGDADYDDDETDQDSPNTATLNPNQDQTVDQDDTVILGDDNAPYQSPYPLV